MFLKIQICSEKSKKVEKSKMMEGEYEIHTDLPSARALRFNSDEWDLSPTVFYHCSARPGELDEDELVTLRHTFLVVFVDRVVVGS